MGSKMEIIASILLIIFFWKYDAITGFFKSLFTQSYDEESQPIQSETESTISDTKKAEISTLVNLLQQKQVMDSTEVAVTRFQDELKATTRTKEEVEKENNIIKNKRIIKDAKETFDEIKSELLRKGKNGEYTIISEKKVITATVNIPTDYYKRTDVPATFEKVRKSFFEGPRPSLSLSEGDDHTQAILRLNKFEIDHYRLVLKTHRKAVFEPISDSDYNLFLEELKRLTAAENITISPIIIDKTNNKEYSFPGSVEGNTKWNEYFCLIKCVCIVPES